VIAEVIVTVKNGTVDLADWGAVLLILVAFLVGRKS